MPFIPFMILSTSGSLIWNTILVLAGKAAGDSWEKVSEIFGVYSNLLLMIAGSALLLFAMMRQVHQMENRDEK
jgi:membrane protein DedA with SNARE-associated domain